MLGDGTTKESASPVSVTGVGNVKDISSGQAHTCVIETNGIIKCWGGE